MSSSKTSGGRWQIALSWNAARSYKKLQLKTAQRINEVLDKLSDDPFTKGVKPIKTEPGSYRYRIGDWRILFGLNKADKIIEVYAIVRRNKAYKKR